MKRKSSMLLVLFVWFMFAVGCQEEPEATPETIIETIYVEETVVVTATPEAVLAAPTATMTFQEQIDALPELEIVEISWQCAGYAKMVYNFEVIGSYEQVFPITVGFGGSFQPNTGTFSINGPQDGSTVTVVARNGGQMVAKTTLKFEQFYGENCSGEQDSQTIVYLASTFNGQRQLYHNSSVNIVVEDMEPVDLIYCNDDGSLLVRYANEFWTAPQYSVHHHSGNCTMLSNNPIQFGVNWELIEYFSLFDKYPYGELTFQLKEAGYEGYADASGTINETYNGSWIYLYQGMRVQIWDVDPTNQWALVTHEPSPGSVIHFWVNQQYIDIDAPLWFLSDRGLMGQEAMFQYIQTVSQ